MERTIPPNLTPSQSYAAGYSLGRSIRQRKNKKDLKQDLEHFVTSRYGNYAQYELIRMGFVKGYVTKAFSDQSNIFYPASPLESA
jgi:hypothetical protein